MWLLFVVALIAFAAGYVIGAARTKSQLARPLGGGSIVGGINATGTGRPAPRTGDDGTRAS